MNNLHEDRPWGSYDILYTHEASDGSVDTVVKILKVKPHARLSYQSHAHRAEEWRIIAGAAEVTIEDEVHTYSKDEVVEIPLGAKHRLSNPNEEELFLLEVGTGEYSESDIVRYEDDYGRI